eukprot:scaffold1102_cov256-Pinguiococcus_pyrenoidosus.AAC.17
MGFIESRRGGDDKVPLRIVLQGVQDGERRLVAVAERATRCPLETVAFHRVAIGDGGRKLDFEGAS